MRPSPEIPEPEIRERCKHMLSEAANEAVRLKHPYIGTEHMFIAATRRESSLTNKMLVQAGFTPRQVRNEIRREVGVGDGEPKDVLPLTPRSGMVLSLTIFLAEQDGVYKPDESHLLMALLQEGEGVPIRKLVDMGFDLDHWLQKQLNEQHQPTIYSQIDLNDADKIDLWEDDLDLDLSDLELLDAEDEERPYIEETPLLDRYGRDLTAQAAEDKITAAIAREEEIRAVARTLARSKKNNPLLIGDAGVGKTAIVEGLAYAIHNQTAPKTLRDRRIVQIEISNLVAGTSLRGQFEERLVGIVNEARDTGNIILFIDEIHTIVGAGDTIDSNLDAANILKPALARGEIICIGATTHEEYRRAIARDPALDRRFRTIDVEESSEDASVEILNASRPRLEQHHGVVIEEDTIQAAVSLSVRYLPDRRLPDKALDLLDEACTRVTIRSVEPEEDEVEQRKVQVEDIASVLSEWTGIHITQLTKDEKKRLIDLDKALMQRVIGQDTCIRLVADAIKTARAGLNDPNRPFGVFLFLGPSGVGKTELARAIARILFDSEDAMLRLDMSELHESHAISRLIGSPPGYRESNRGGQLTEGLRRHPYSVVLLDEIEKAAPEIFDLFLQVFDEGRLSDANGRSIDARHAIFIMTSNVGTIEGSKSFGFTGGEDDNQPDYSSYLNQYFRPEFLNRIDEVITFRLLSRETLSQILDMQLGELRKRLSGRRLELHLTEAGRTLILNEGYDPVNGARPLKRAIERLLTRPLSAKIVDETFAPGDTIIVSAENDSLIFSTESIAAT